MAAESFSVSVVIPAYNEAERLGQAIAAIRNQTEPPSEIIVVDDGSKDGTAAIASGLGVRVIRQANGGIASARNTGVRNATGTWIAFCDADDVWDRDMLALARRAHELRPDAGFIFADHCTNVGGVVTLASRFHSCPQFTAAAGTRVAGDIVFFERGPLAQALARTNFIAPSTALIRRELMLAHELFFNASLPSTREFHVAEDIEWYLRVLSVSDGLAIDRVMLTYHRHDGSVSDNPGRVSYGNAKLGELVARDPDRYAPGVDVTYARSRRAHIRESAIDDLRTFRFSSARGKLMEAQAIAARPADAALALVATVASLPGGVLVADTGRRAWRSILKPFLRAIVRRAS